MNKVQKCGEKLKDPLLLANIVKEVQKEGVVGEEDVIMSLIMKIMLRHVINADKTSSNLVVSDKSGGGKDFLVKAVCKVMLPEKDYFHRTGLSEKVFYLLEKQSKRIFYGGMGRSYTLKTQIKTSVNLRASGLWLPDKPKYNSKRPRGS